jgi:hydroxymethylglutaryl-CoA synthase
MTAMPVGIERLDLYTSRLSIDALELAAARGKDAREMADNVMIQERAVVPVFEDAVTMAVNAAKRVLTAADVKDIELLIVGSESEVDGSKPISTWVHRFCELPENCRSFDLKHACYGGTGALKMAASWVASGARPGKKALVVSSDFSQPSLVRSGYDFVGGGCAAAMLVSGNPETITFDLKRSGYWTQEIYDTCRPAPGIEVIDNQLSLYAYLDALDGAFEHYERVNGKVDFAADFNRHIYHAPFPGMAFQAHQTMLRRMSVADPSTIRESFERKVRGGLLYARRLGSCYGASNFVCLLGQIASAGQASELGKISFFAYGSGCQGEFYDGVAGGNVYDPVRIRSIDRHLNDRERVSIDQYESIESRRSATTGCPDWMPGSDDGVYERHYHGKGLLVLRKVQNYQRSYDWS